MLQEKKVKGIDAHCILGEASALRDNMPALLALVKQYPVLRQKRIKGLTPIIYSVAVCDSLQIPAFLEAGVTINQCDDQGKTALTKSAAYESPNPARALLENKACIDIVDDANSDALMYAFSNVHGGPIVEDLIKHPSFPAIINRTVGIPYTRSYQASTYLQQALKKMDYWYPNCKRIIDTLLKLGATVGIEELGCAANNSDNLSLVLPYCSFDVLTAFDHKHKPIKESCLELIHGHMNHMHASDLRVQEALGVHMPPVLADIVRECMGLHKKTLVKKDSPLPIGE